MKICASLILFLFGVICSGFGEQLVSTQNRVILAESSSNLWLDIEWVPTEEQTEKAIDAIERFLNNDESLKKQGKRQAEEAVKIRNHFGEYRAQFAGVIEEGGQYIHCNFFPAARYFSDWENKFISVFDSGFWYWNALYDPLTGELVRFQINGYL